MRLQYNFLDKRALVVVVSLLQLKNKPNFAFTAPRSNQLLRLRAGMVLEYTQFSCVILWHRIKSCGAVLKLSGKAFMVSRVSLQKIELLTYHSSKDPGGKFWFQIWLKFFWDTLDTIKASESFRTAPQLLILCNKMTQENEVYSSTIPAQILSSWNSCREP